MHSVMAQFGHPRGILGQLVGRIMAYENRERNQWAVSQLDVQPNEHILEIGFGPGLAIHYLAHSTAARFIAGVDDSPIMVQQARQRNAAAICSGRVELQHGSVTQLPYPEAAFDTVFAVNSFHHWPSPADNLREVWRVVKPGGRIAIIEQPRGAATDAVIQARGQELVAMLTSAELQAVRIAVKPMRPAASICALGTK
jgi:ubiquinone/menaquinone biosynthesis C-methylase UbiE